MYNLRPLAAVSTIAMLGFAALLGCTDFGAPVKVDNGNGGDTLVSFLASVRPVLVDRCDGGGCHFPCAPSNARNLCVNTQATIIASGSVIPGNGANSRLYRAIKGLSSPRMPLSQVPLSDSTIEVIKKWIDQGARDN